MNVKVSSDDPETENIAMDEDDSVSWIADAHITNANYQAKKMVFLLFINREISITLHTEAAYFLGRHRQIGRISSDETRI